jgi:peptide/nickel transport system substrate-binding protein
MKSAACIRFVPLLGAALATVAVLGGGSAAGAPKTAGAGGSLVVAVTADGYYATPRWPTVGRYPTNANVAETLVRMTQSYRVVPDLAVRWRHVGANTWRFFLRRGVRFQNGQPFDANAVKYTFELYAKSGAGRSIGLDDKASINVVNRYTVDVTPGFQNNRLIEQLVHPSRAILAPGSTPDNPIGTGPFKLASYTRNQQLVVQRWGGYWGKKAKLSQITFKFVPDANARALALESGAVQVAADIPRESTREVKSRSSLLVKHSRVGSYEAIYFTLRGAPGYELGSNRAVRPAVGFAIDRKVIVNTVWQRNAAVIETMVPPRILGKYSGLVHGYRYDPAKARALLAKDGWKLGRDGIRARGGRKLQLTMVVGFPNADIHGSMPEAVQSMLRKVGIDVRIVRTPDASTYSDMLKKGQGDMFVEVGSQNDANPCFLPDLLFYYKTAAKTDYGYHFGPGRGFDKLIETRCRRSTSIAAAQRGAAQAMHFLIDGDHEVVPIAGIFRIYGLQKSVRGFHPNPSQTNQGWSTVSVSR